MNTKKKNEDFLHLYLGCEMICHERFDPNKKECHPKGPGYCYLTADLLSDIHINRFQEFTSHFKLLLRQYEDITDVEWMEAWSVIGGEPHLFEYGIEDFKHSLLEGYWDDTGIQMDYFTMSQLINYFRKTGIDCDDLIDSEKAVYKIEYEKK